MLKLFTEYKIDGIFILLQNHLRLDQISIHSLLPEILNRLGG